MCLNHQSLAKLRISHTHADNLHVGYADIEGLHQVSMPYEAHIGHKKCAKIALFTREVPHSVDLQRHASSNLTIQKQEKEELCAQSYNLLT